jgi:hypothetical protein
LIRLEAEKGKREMTFNAQTINFTPVSTSLIMFIVNFYSLMNFNVEYFEKTITFSW